MMELFLMRLCIKLFFCFVILQCDFMVKKGKDIRRLLERRLALWRNRSFSVLVQEAERCDKHFRSTHLSQPDSEQAIRVFSRLMLKGKIHEAVRWITERSEAERCDKHFRSTHLSQPDSEQAIRVFSHLMLKGKIREAVRWITERSGGGILDPSSFLEDQGKSVFDVLKEKHPNPSLLGVIALPHHQPLPEWEDVDITAEVVEKVSRRLHGGGGPGGTPSDQWQDFLLCYGSKSSQLRQAVANLAMKLANSIVEWVDIRALMSNRLIALDKCPGVRPIGVGECLRRILGKCLIERTGIDITEACGAKQLCSGLRAGIEGAIHAFSSLFNKKASSGWGVLLVDASNAFNSSNRIAALLNARVLWPRCARFLFNSYRGCASLFVRGSTELLFSKEGVTQGDPLSMAFYGLSVLPLIDLLSDPDGRQSWFADDSSCCANFLVLRRWWDLLVLHGPSFGYHPEPQKSVLIVHPSLLGEASRLFRDVGIKVVTGSRFLGGYIGNEEGKRSFLEEKVKVWTNSLLKLTEAAISQPQAAFAAVSKSLQCEWGFIQRVVSGSSEFFVPIQKAIEEEFFPALLGGPISSVEASIFSLPAKLGGLGIRDPVKSGDLSFRTSQEGTLVLSKAIKNLGAFDMINHNAALNNTLSMMKSRRDEIHKEVLHHALDSLPLASKRAIGRAANNKISAWLTVMPIARHHFDLSANEFRDGLALRYMRLATLPASCDGCGDAFNIDHALNCKTGGLIIGRHNEIRDAIGDLAAQAWGHSNVWKEPIIQEANQVSGIIGLQADLAVQGVWEPQGDALFDIHVVNTDASSYRTRSVDAVLKSATQDKKNKYGLACEERHSSFTPLVLSVDGVLEQEAVGFIRRIAERLAAKWDKSFGETLGWVRARLTFAILRATSMCLRGTRVRWRCLGFEDGAGIGYSLNK